MASSDMLREIIGYVLDNSESHWVPPIDLRNEIGLMGWDEMLKNYERWYLRVLFDHNFAQAFFGFGRFHTCLGNACDFFHHGWVWHLQRAVISEDIIDYYFSFLEQEVD